ncbi:multiple sugar transport system substrate-binding protein [Mycetocola sp. CAN_C7]|uniref:ABC transporter substrate-binding protein n=1 Tax=Mycetocola sp. CAN_C7 TaxID=2787724 RepID=UPI0018CAFD4A
MKKTTPLAALGVASLLALTACASGSDEGSADAVTLDYWLWDDIQLPLYQECADAFTEENPNITINITQTGWAQYWQNLSTQITAGTAPDVFTNQISYYLQFVQNNQLLDLTENVEASDIDFADYKEGLAERWVTDGKRYGLPKDWDTVALLYNVEAATEAGYTAEQLSTLTWNPEDGGTFGELVKAMTVDGAGRDGLDPNFDKSDVVRYGYYPEWADGAIGQNGWGNFAHSAGFTYSDDEGAPTTFNFDSEPLIETGAWLQSLIEDGYAPGFDEQSTLGTQAVMENQNVASTITGSWMASTYLAEDAPVEFGFAMVPEGPDGRTAATNGLADSVWAGTEHPEEAYQWVEYLASADCQNSVGEAGLIFPALDSGTEAALEARDAAGFDSSAFASVADAGETFTIPAFERSAEVNSAIQDAMQAIAQGADPAERLSEANDAVEALFK